jgi:hypothetical protein
MNIKNWKWVALIVAALLIGGSALAEDKRERHPHAFAKDVDALHAALAPLWHAQPGKERARNVCAQVERLDGLAREIRSGDARAMLASIEGLKAQCLASPAEIDAAFAKVHDAFHDLAEPGRR